MIANLLKLAIPRPQVSDQPDQVEPPSVGTDQDVKPSIDGNSVTSTSLKEVGELAVAILKDKKLQVGEVVPFFWTIVETYVDRFKVYPFDVEKALFSYMEIRGYPETKIIELINKLELLYQQQYGKSPRDKKERIEPSYTLEDDLEELSQSIKYAVLVDELDLED